jgi:hypothetical protein
VPPHRSRPSVALPFKSEQLSICPICDGMQRVKQEFNILFEGHFRTYLTKEMALKWAEKAAQANRSANLNKFERKKAS